MKKQIIIILKTTFTIIGTIIGAGFISGREILTFFDGKNIYFAIAVLFILLSVSLSFLVCARSFENYRLLIIFEPLILVGNLIIMSGMISVINEIIFNNFKVLNDFKILSILTLLLSYFIMKKGIDYMKIVNAVFVPILLIFLLIAFFCLKCKYQEIIFNFKVYSIFTYVGVNTFMSSKIFISLGQDLSKKQAVFSGILSSLIICLIVYNIFIRLQSFGYVATILPVPITLLFKNNRVLSLLFSFVMYIGVTTTLISSHYPLFEFCENFKRKNLMNWLVLILAILLSLFGFYNIINFIYPILGLIGVIYLAIAVCYKLFSRKKSHYNCCFNKLNGN